MVVLVVLAVLLLRVVVLVLLRVVLLLAVWLGLRLGVGLGYGDQLEEEEDLSVEVSGDRSRAGKVLILLPGCWGRPCGSRRAFSSPLLGCGSGFGRGLVDKGGGEGRGGGGG